MKSVEESKQIYDSIEIPKELNAVVEKAIASKKKEDIMGKRRQYIMRKTVKYFGAVAAGFVVCVTLGLNTSEAFAKEMAELPIIGNIAKVLTVRSYHHLDEETGVNVNMEVPKVEVEQPVTEPETELPEEQPGTEGIQPDTQFVADINAEIEKIVDEHMAKAEQDFADYKKAFFETGGTEEEWADRTMDVNISYDVKYEEGNILSFVLSVGEAWVASFEQQYFYNLDLKENRELTLQDMLGDDWENIANESIISQMKERMAADESYVYWGIDESDESGITGFEGVNADTTFYIAANGNPVVTFAEYEVAPGFMGAQEFEIVK